MKKLKTFAVIAILTLVFSCATSQKTDMSPTVTEVHTVSNTVFNIIIEIYGNK